MVAMADRLGYLPLNNRPRIRWPNDERVAFWIGLNVEFFEYLPTQSRAGQEAGGGNPMYPPPDIQNHVRRDYGNRIGFWRMLEVFDKHKIRCTVNINVALLDHFPEERDAMLKRNWEFCFHGFYNTRNDPKGFTEDQERALYREAVESLTRATGERPKGACILGRATEHTPDLLAEEGFVYHADWFHDDQPTPIAVRAGRLVSVPYSAELNDSLLVSRNRGLEQDYLLQIGKDQFDRLYAEGDQNGMVMCLALHPWVSGYPWRINYLEQLLDYVMGHDKVWQTTAGEIAEHYVAHYYDEAVAHMDQLNRGQLGRRATG